MYIFRLLGWAALSGLMTAIGCTSAADIPPTPTPPALAQTLTVHGWADGFPPSIFEAFTAETGVTIVYRPYDVGYTEPLANMTAGDPLDVVILGNDYIDVAVNADLLAELELGNIPNLRNIAANFRDLAYDPGNRYSIPYDWGTTGLLVRRDLFTAPVVSWGALWEGEAGKVGIWEDDRSLIGLTLRWLGYSANSDDPAALEAALEHLLQLKQRAISLGDFDSWSSAAALDEGAVSIAFGWAYDALAGRNLNTAIEYVIPQEGTLLWIENFVIPASSPNKYTAERFIDFMLRPEIAAQYTNEIYYASTVEPARDFIDPAVLADPVVFPTDAMLANAELLLPLSPEARVLYDALWQRFLDAPAFGDAP